MATSSLQSFNVATYLHYSRKPFTIALDLAGINQRNGCARLFRVRCEQSGEWCTQRSWKVLDHCDSVFDRFSCRVSVQSVKSEKQRKVGIVVMSAFIRWAPAHCAYRLKR